MIKNKTVKLGTDNNFHINDRRTCKISDNDDFKGGHFVGGGYRLEYNTNNTFIETLSYADFLDFPVIEFFLAKNKIYPSLFRLNNKYRINDIYNIILKLDKTFYTETSYSIKYDKNQEKENSIKYEANVPNFIGFYLEKFGIFLYINIIGLMTETLEEQDSIGEVFINTFYDPNIYTTDEINNILKNELFPLVPYKKPVIVNDNTGDIYILSVNNQGRFTTIKNTINIPDVDIDINYNDDFKEIDEIIQNRLNIESSKGLILLHGTPGTGKTTYIRYLLNKVNKKFIFIPPNLTDSISDPNFIQFFLDNRDCILVIEDAENILKKRINGSSQAISNILNLSDGLLADCLNIQIIATFNSDLNNIDDALLRKGRLLAQYEFKELSYNKTEKLKNKLGIETNNDSKTLAEIYNSYEKSFTKENKRIGF